MMQFPARRTFSVNLVRSLMIGCAFTTIVSILFLPFQDNLLGQFFLKRGITQQLVLLLAGVVIDFTLQKLQRIRSEKRSARKEWLPDTLPEAGPESQEIRVIQELLSQKETILTSRIGRILAAYIRSQRRFVAVELYSEDVAMAQGESANSYQIPKILVWAMPLLGFVGTVLGISQSIGGFSSLLQNMKDVEVVKTSLSKVTDGLSTAFDTTLLGLICAIACMFLLVFVETQEEQLLVTINTYLSDELLARLKEPS